MNFNQKKSLFAVSSRLARAAVAITAAALLVACGGGGSVAVDAPQSAVATTNLRALPAEYLARKAVSYSPFRTANRDTETPTATQIEEDLRLLVAGNFKLIRLFDSSDKVSKLTLKVIKDNSLDIKVHLGAYVNSYKYVYNPVVNASIKAGNQAELDRLIALATNPDYKDIVLAVSVGNETMVNWSTVPIDPADMAGYISYVRTQVTQPVTTDDNFVFYSEIPQRISDLIDFASIHTYTEIDTQYPASPYFWDWRQEGVPLAGTDKTARAAAMMNASMVATRAQYQMVRDSLDRKGLGNIPIVIGETGWNAVDLGKLRFRANPVNQKMYLTRLETWRAEGRVGPGPANVIYFEAFDEPWKGGDDKWGLFNVDRKARCVVQGYYAPTLWETGSCADTDSVAFVAPAPNTAFASATYAIFSNLTTPVANLRLDAFGNFSGGVTAQYPTVATNSSPDGGNNLEITPTPEVYGWGLLYSPQVPYATENLSAFSHINFWIKTAYAGKIEVGLSTDTALGDVQEAYVQIGKGDYGYDNTNNQWNRVSIPLQAFLAVNPKLDSSMVLNRFVIADRYSYTGKASGANITTKLYVDGITWTK